MSRLKENIGPLKSNNILGEPRNKYKNKAYPFEVRIGQGHRWRRHLSNTVAYFLSYWGVSLDLTLDYVWGSHEVCWSVTIKGGWVVQGVWVGEC